MTLTMMRKQNNNNSKNNNEKNIKNEKNIERDNDKDTMMIPNKCWAKWRPLAG